jgi:PAS domain S-box-containing protein
MQQNLALEQVIAGAPIGIAVFDRDMRYIHASRDFLVSWGAVDIAVVGKSHYEVFPDVPEHRKSLHRRCLAGATESAMADEFVRVDGSVQYADWQCEPWRDSSGEIGGIVIYSKDVTGEVLAKKSAGEAEDSLTAIVSNFPGAIVKIRVEPNGQRWLLYAQFYGGTFAGYTVADWNSMPSSPLTSDLLHPSEKTAVSEKLKQRDRAGGGTIEYRIRHKDGHYIWIRNMATVRPDADGGYWLSVFLQDISAEKAQAERLVAAQRHIRIGLLASGIAHEMSQPLAAISLSTENAMVELERQQPRYDRLQTRLQRIVSQCERATKLIVDMRLFAEASAIDASAVSVHDLISRAVSSVQHRLEDAGVKVTMALTEGLPTIQAAPALFEQVLFTLLGNSLDAYQSHASEKCSEKVIAISACLNEDLRVRLEIRDHAGGIPAELLASVFEPFVTTKGPDKGRGLGLAISHAIVVELGGEISVRNCEDGAVFTILLPAIEMTEPAPSSRS